MTYRKQNRLQCKKYVFFFFLYQLQYFPAVTNLFSKKKIEENLEFTSTHQVEVPKKEGIKPGIRKKKGDASDE